MNKCLNCGKDTPNEKFCKHKCMGESYIGKNNPHYKERPIKYCICGCNRLIEGSPYLIKKKQFYSQKCRGKYYSGENNPFYNKHHKEESKLKQRLKWKDKYENNYINPRKGKRNTKKSNERHSKTTRRLFKEGKIIHGMLGKHQTEESKKKTNLTWRRKYDKEEYINGFKGCNWGMCKKHGIEHKHGMEGEHHTEESKRKIILGQHTTPNKMELKLDSFLQKYFSNEWMLNVKTKGVIIDNKVPDFVNCNGKKIFIESFYDFFKNRDYGSVENYIKERSEVFSKYGYKTIFIDYKEFKDENRLVEKIKTKMI